MPPRPERIQYLIRQYAAGSCTRSELVELLEMVALAKSDDAFRDALETVWHDVTDAEVPASIDKERIFHHVMGADMDMGGGMASGAGTGRDADLPAAIGEFPRTRAKWFMAAAAAVLALSLGSGAYYYFRHAPANPAKLATTSTHLKNDVLPGGNKAVLTLANGSTIVLDSARNGALARQGNTTVVKMDSGELRFEGGAGSMARKGGDGQGGQGAYGKAGTGQDAPETAYNTITTPRGGKYEIVLPDGSKVWLNAASSLRFPTAFGGKERHVILTGEAYFEIQKNKAQPFSVTVGQMKVEVLGTNFNIMAYNDEGAVKTTLVDGAVKVVSPNQSSVTLNRGEQAELKIDGHLKVNGNTDMNETLAWKEGVFYFHDADVNTVMRQLARWYNIDVVYKGEVKDRFYAKIPRNTNLSVVLRALTLTGSLKLDIVGSSVMVQP